MYTRCYLINNKALKNRNSKCGLFPNKKLIHYNSHRWFKLKNSRGPHLLSQLTEKKAKSNIHSDLRHRHKIEANLL